MDIALYLTSDLFLQVFTVIRKWGRVMATPAAPRGRVRRGAPPTSASAWTGPDARPVCTVSPPPPSPQPPTTDQTLIQLLAVHSGQSTICWKTKTMPEIIDTDKLRRINTRGILPWSEQSLFPRIYNNSFRPAYSLENESLQRLLNSGNLSRTQVNVVILWEQVAFYLVITLKRINYLDNKIQINSALITILKYLGVGG